VETLDIVNDQLTAHCH